MEPVSGVADMPQVSFKKRNTKSKPSFRKRATPPPSDSDSGFTTSEDEEGRQVKRRKRNVGITVSSGDQSANISKDKPAQAAAPSVVPTATDDATKASNWYDEDDTTAINPPVSKSVESSAADGTYRGVANYQSFIQKNSNAVSRQVGPVKASTNVRTITVTDFAPDVCKDYKQTGYCGYGDGCKFTHMRENFKQGWELDRDWEIGMKGKKIAGKTVASANRTNATGNAEDEDDDVQFENIPFACFICKKSYTNPIVTKCGHYFCESCALQRYKKNPNCSACGAGTGGVFNAAKKLNKLLDKKRERAKKKREKAIENGEQVSDESDAGEIIRDFE